ncbi:hypothetical protein J0A68_02385 [Algoriphagus sp. H41]|uniref:Uncharacterized protein n=1 Tax=Algoriphagus oliviformis TaxID=2811231 RepID=A0ABS3BY40_9BACT|nr:hypothetical protein [Algoriphagus oliviformis]MBN7809788.1 hypothetical protein [Algoriphagus oliviformis]
MAGRDSILTPELVKVLKIFIFSALALVLVLSFFNEYRADNTGEDRSFKVADSDRIYFQNVRAINYEREIRRDAGMTLFRHRNRLETDTRPTLDLVILLNPSKDEAYVYFELANADWPVRIQTSLSGNQEIFDFANGNNHAHLELFKKLLPAIKGDAEFKLIVGEKSFPLWAGEEEKEALKTIAEDYLRLLAKTN